jgi:Zn-dependent protease with chaperone function
MERLTYSAHCSALIELDEEKAETKERKKENKKKYDVSTPKIDDTNTQDLIEKGISVERKVRCDRLIRNEKSSSSKVLDYFSSHPETDERTATFRSQPAMKK